MTSESLKLCRVSTIWSCPRIHNEKEAKTTHSAEAERDGLVKAGRLRGGWGGRWTTKRDEEKKAKLQ